MSKQTGTKKIRRAVIRLGSGPAYMGQMLRKHKTPLLVFVLPVAFVFASTLLVENRAEKATASWLETCFQFVTGNWPPPNPALDHRGWVFAAGVTFRFALIYGGLAGLLKIWRDLVAWKKEETIMKYSEMLRDRDLSIENEVNGLLGRISDPQVRVQIARDIHRAFEHGAQVWAQQHLPALVGPDAARAIIEKLQREQVIG